MSKQNSAGGILTEAANIVEGSRQTTHGDKERSFDWIAKQWELTLSMRSAGRDAPINGATVALMLADLKKVRLLQGIPVRDHFVDGPGYFAIAGEIMLDEIARKAVPPQQAMPLDGKPPVEFVANIGAPSLDAGGVIHGFVPGLNVAKKPELYDGAGYPPAGSEDDPYALRTGD